MCPRLPQFYQHHRRREKAVEGSCRFLNGSEEDTSSSSPSQDSYAHVFCQTCPEALYNSNTTFSHAQKSSVKTETGIKRKTTIKEVEDEESTPSGHFQEQPHQKQKRPEPFLSLWILSQLRDLAAEAGIGMLKQSKTTRSEQRPHSTIIKHPHQ